MKKKQYFWRTSRNTKFAMMREQEKKDSFDRADVYSKIVRAGRRTYFFDVKQTKEKDQFITITESRRSTNSDGRVNYEKQKIFLYREDFLKFSDSLTELIAFIDSNSVDIPEIETIKSFTDIQYEDITR